VAPVTANAVEVVVDVPGDAVESVVGDGFVDADG
jgi:hypothetical protein